MDGFEFESFMTKVLNHVGLYKDMKHTPNSNDHGLDAYGKTKDGKKIGFQFKNYSGTVPFHAVEDVMTGAMFYNSQINVVLTNSYFSKNTVKTCRWINHNHPELHIKLEDRMHLFRLIIKYESYNLWNMEQLSGEVEEKRTVLKNKYLEDITIDNETKAKYSTRKKLLRFANKSIRLAAPLLGFYSLYNFDDISKNKDESLNVSDGYSLGEKGLIRLNPIILSRRACNRMILAQTPYGHKGMQYAIEFAYYTRSMIKKRLKKYSKKTKSHDIFHSRNLGFPDYPTYQFKMPMEHGWHFNLHSGPDVVANSTDPIQEYGFTHYFSPNVTKVIITNAIYKPRRIKGTVSKKLYYHNVPYYKECITSCMNGITITPSDRDKPLSVTYYVYDLNTLYELNRGNQYINDKLKRLKESSIKNYNVQFKKKRIEQKKEHRISKLKQLRQAKVMKQRQLQKKKEIKEKYRKTLLKKRHQEKLVEIKKRRQLKQKQIQRDKRREHHIKAQRELKHELRKRKRQQEINKINEFKKRRNLLMWGTSLIILLIIFLAVVIA